jgi:hypothetical protein
MPPGVSADWSRFAYRYFNDAQYYSGLVSAAKILKQIHSPNVDKILNNAIEYKQDIEKSYKWNQAKSPVVKLINSTWVPHYSSILGLFGNIEESLPNNEDMGRIWAYNVDLGSHHLITAGILDPASDEASWQLNHLEDVQFLKSGMETTYQEAKNQTDWFNYGGFSKLQQYYTRVPEIYGMLNEVKPFIRSYFNAIAAMVNLETMYFWEHPGNIGGWNKTHETGWFLCQTRMMLANEKGEDLWLAPLITDH